MCVCVCVCTRHPREFGCCSSATTTLLSELPKQTDALMMAKSPHHKRNRQKEAQRWGMAQWEAYWEREGQ